MASVSRFTSFNLSFVRRPTAQDQTLTQAFVSSFLRSVFLLAVIGLLSMSAFAQQGTFVTTGTPVSGANGTLAVLLNNGKVLIVGLGGSELYDPTLGTFSATGGANPPGAQAAVALNNGKVLVLDGGQAAALYDPSTGLYTPTTGNLVIARTGPTVTRLNDGTVLIAGGRSCGISGCQDFPEIYDGTFSLTGPAVVARSQGATSILLPNGKVLIAGGGSAIPLPGGPTALAISELFDPSTSGPFSRTGDMTTARSFHTATLLNDGKVLVVGGTDPSGSALASAEIFDPATGSYTATGNMQFARSNHSATLLNSGQVLIAGGAATVANGVTVPTPAELYDPTTGIFASTGIPLTFVEYQSVLLADGTVLTLVGVGSDTGGELYEFVGFAPASLSFSSEPVNVKSASQDVVLTNNQSTPLAITSTSVTGTNTADFAETNDCPASVAPAASCTFHVTFTPTSGGNRTANLTVVDNRTVGGPLTVAISGTGVAPAPVVSLSTNGLAFAMQATGKTSGPQTVTLHNTGNAVLHLQNLGITGSNAGDFTITGASTCINGASIAANASCTIQVTFTPSGTGSRTASIGITDNAPDSPQAIQLSGDGPAIPAISVSPSTVTFTGQYIGTTGLPQTVTLTNQGAVSSTVVINSVTASPADFGVLNNCTNGISVGNSCTIGVFFDPSAGGTRTGTLTIVSGSSTQTVALTGQGEDFSLTPGSASSATITAGQSASYSVSVAPAGGFAQSVALTCSGGPAGSMCSVSPSTLALSGAAAQTAKVTVTTTAQGWVPSIVALPPGTNRWSPLIPALLRMFLLLLVAAALGTLIQRRDKRLRLAPAFALALIIGLCLTLTSCGGGSGSNSGGTGLQSGTYTVTVTGNFATGSTNLTHAAKLTLVVQ